MYIRPCIIFSGGHSSSCADIPKGTDLDLKQHRCRSQQLEGPSSVWSVVRCVLNGVCSGAAAGAGQQQQQGKGPQQGHS